MRGHRARPRSGPPSVPRCLAQETKSRAVAFALAGGQEWNVSRPTDFCLGNSVNPDSVRPLSPALVYIAHGRTCVEQASGLLSWPTTTTMLGAEVTATATYCGHTLQAETDVDDLGRWTGRCVVGGPQFQGTVVLYSPFRAPTAALDALLTAARRSIDEGRSGTRRRSTRRRRLA
jgi:hypothetical protein